MAPASSKMEPTFWSSCSLEYLALAFEHGMDYCLRNKPTTLFDGPVCGNGFVEQVTSLIRRNTFNSLLAFEVRYLRYEKIIELVSLTTFYFTT